MLASQTDFPQRGKDYSFTTLPSQSLEAIMSRLLGPVMKPRQCIIDIMLVGYEDLLVLHPIRPNAMQPARKFNKLVINLRHQYIGLDLLRLHSKFRSVRAANCSAINHMVGIEEGEAKGSMVVYEEIKYCGTPDIFVDRQKLMDTTTGWRWDLQKYLSEKDFP